ncbi:MAG: hypothetical protein JWR07_5339 [Nevskia sp.]|nr:hypothetical protein [Nevskia sp.]
MEPLFLPMKKSNVESNFSQVTRLDYCCPGASGGTVGGGRR